MALKTINLDWSKKLPWLLEFDVDAYALKKGPDRVLSIADLGPLNEVIGIGMKRPEIIDCDMKVFSDYVYRKGPFDFKFTFEFDGKRPYVITQIFYHSPDLELNAKEGERGVLPHRQTPKSVLIYKWGKCIPNEPSPLWSEIRLLAIADLERVKGELNVKVDSDHSRIRAAQTESIERTQALLLSGKLPRQNQVLPGMNLANYINLLSRRKDSREVARELANLNEFITEIRNTNSERNEDGPSLYSYTGELVGKIIPELLDPYLALPSGSAERVMLAGGISAKDALIEQIGMIDQKLRSWSAVHQISQLEINRRNIDSIIER